IVGDVAHQLDPNVMTNVRSNWTTQAGLDERVGDLAAALTFRSIRLSNREARSFDMPNHPWFNQRRRRVDDATNHARRIDVSANWAARIDAFKGRAFPLAAVFIEVPPRKTVLRGNDGGAFTDERCEIRRHRRQALRLQGDDDDVDFTDAARVIGRFRVDMK